MHATGMLQPCVIHVYWVDNNVEIILYYPILWIILGESVPRSKITNKWFVYFN